MKLTTCVPKKVYSRVPGRYGRLAAGIGLVIIFFIWLAPGLAAWLHSPVHRLIYEDNIKTNAWFYTDSDAFDQGTAALGDGLRFYPRKQ